MAPAIPAQRSFLDFARHQPPDQLPFTFYDVRFYPYLGPEDDQIFAVTGQRVVIIARAVDQAKNAIEILHYIREENPELDPEQKGEDKEEYLNAVAWSQDLKTGNPLLIVAGKQRLMKLYDALTGQLIRSLSGHGAPINDILTHPLDPRILASSSMDHTIRLWNLSEHAAKSPTPVICAGSHMDGVMGIDFHANGRWLLSGGHDTSVRLFHLPEISGDDAPVNNSEIIRDPHFASTEIHSDFVDRIKWHGDLIISKCAEEHTILLWRITGFSATSTPPPAPVAESPATATSLASYSLSAWTDKSDLGPFPPFQRLLRFDAPHTGLQFMRFGLLNIPTQRHVLAMGDQRNHFYFWDLQSIEDGSEPILPRKGRGGRKKKAETKAKPVPQSTTAPLTKVTREERGLRPQPATATAATENQSGSRRSSPSSRATSSCVQESRYAANRSASAVAIPAPNEPDAEKPKYRIPHSDPIPAHYEFNIPRYSCPVRTMAWSPNGKWCVACGEQGLLTMFRRLEDGSMEERKNGEGMSTAGSKERSAEQDDDEEGSDEQTCDEDAMDTEE